MIQKLFKPKPSQIYAIYALILCLAIIIFYATPLFAAGLAPPTATTEAYMGTDINGNPIILWIQFFVNLLSVVIVVGSAVMIAFAGVQYTSSRDNAQGVQDAKKKIFNVVLGLLAYAFLYAFVQWLIPGGGGVFDAPATTP